MSFKVGDRVKNIKSAYFKEDGFSGLVDFGVVTEIYVDGLDVLWDTCKCPYPCCSGEVELVSRGSTRESIENTLTEFDADSPMGIVLDYYKNKESKHTKYNLRAIDFDPDTDDIDAAFDWDLTPEGFGYWAGFSSNNLAPKEMKEAQSKWDAMKQQWYKENQKPKGDNVKHPSDGGPSPYYDFKDSYKTFNDWMEDKAKSQWGAYSLHMKDLGKGMCRFGTKHGVTEGYDINKMLYSTIRMKVMEVGKKSAVEYILSVLDDPQFKE